MIRSRLGMSAYYRKKRRLGGRTRGPLTLPGGIGVPNTLLSQARNFRRVTLDSLVFGEEKHACARERAAGAWARPGRGLGVADALGSSFERRPTERGT